MHRRLIYLALILLAVMHQDFWFWDDATLVFGFLPIGLAYHSAYCIVAAGIWFLATKYAWPVSDAEAEDPPR